MQRLVNILWSKQCEVTVHLPENQERATVVISPSPPSKKQVHFSSSSNWFEVLGSKLSNLPVLLDATDAESTTASHLSCRIVNIMVKG
ncbi:hypothetical protein ES288_D12G154000v1 [Gossypium darwinii]|uniref:Uncharacterized protein n=1 Tax=Gossypium darwinii TaxID=34276 RepID=A0A5D2AB80_GOSDA|nr:hypothetical protein ES288_D12G154000v1 [Gossypium darwinii]